MNRNRSRLQCASCTRSSSRPAVVVIGLLAFAVMSACESEPTQVSLGSFEVDRQWRRSVGDPQLELSPPRATLADAGVVVAFRPTATVEQVSISRAFVVASEATVIRTGRGDQSPIDLRAVASAEVTQQYPGLASNAETLIEPREVTLRDVVIEVDGRPSRGDVQMSIDPQSPVFDSARPTALSASDVQVVAARIIGSDDSRSVLIEGEMLQAGQPGEQRLVFPIGNLGATECRKLRSLLLGEYAIEADCEIRTGARSVVVETRVFPAAEMREWRDPVRRAARERLTALASIPAEEALVLELSADSEVAFRGEALPIVAVVNRSSQPILDLRDFMAAYQIDAPNGLRFVGSGNGEGEPCLCPGESISIETTEILPPCGDSVGGSDATHGLIILVSSSGLERRKLGPVPVIAVEASGALLAPPRIAGREVVIEAVSENAAESLQLRLSIEGEGEIVLPFPAIAAGGRASLTLPEALGSDASATWEAWRGGGRRVEVELLEAGLWECEGAAPSRQAFRMVG